MATAALTAAAATAAALAIPLLAIREDKEFEEEDEILGGDDDEEAELVAVLGDLSAASARGGELLLLRLLPLAVRDASECVDSRWSCSSRVEMDWKRREPDACLVTVGTTKA